MKIEACESADHPGWLRLREALWPGSRAGDLAEMKLFVSQPARFRQFIAYSLSAVARWARGAGVVFFRRVLE